MKKKILLVDKNQAISFLIATLLEKNYETVQVLNSYYAMQELFSSRTFDMIIVSIVLENADSFQLIQHIKSCNLLKDIPVMVLAHSSVANLESDYKDLGVAEFIKKPFIPQILIQKTEELTFIQQPRIIIRKKASFFNLNFWL